METICSESAHAEGPLFLIDGNNIAYRGFFALPQEISTSGGFPTNALYGFCLMMIKILSEYRPGAVIVAWDSREKTFRHAEFQEYKAQRKPMPDLLAEQWPYFAEISSAFGFVNLAIPGYEADDILGTLARQAEAEGRPTTIVTGDRDALQLAGRAVNVMANTRGVTEVKIYDPAAVEERFGVPPGLIPDLIGLKGDTSDNIPGVPGIGEKTAAELLTRFGTLEEVLAHIEDISGPKRRQLLEENRELALLSKKLATLDCDVPIDIETAEVVPHKPQREKLEELLTRFEFTSLLDRVAPLLEEAAPREAGQAGSELPAAVEISGDPARWGDLIDRSRPVALVAGPGTSGLWLAQAGSGREPEDYGSFAVLMMPDPIAEAGALTPFLEGRRVVCHDFKSSPVLRGLLHQADHDTYIAAYLLSPGRREYRLDDLAHDEGIRRPACPEGETVPAAAVEAALTLAVSYRQEKSLREQGMWDLFQEIELPLTRVLVDMEETGINLDCYRLGEMAGKIQDQLEELESSIYELAGEEFNLGSPQQLGRVLFERLQLPRQRKTKTGYSTDAKTLEALRESHPIVSHLLSHRELSKLMSTYLLALPQAVKPATGRLHTTFNQTVAATGRLSSSDPNLQNIPVRTALGAQIRECFTAEPKKVLVVMDYSQIELRVMARLSGEPTLLEALRRGEDIHARTAAEVFGMAQDEVDATHRRYAKAVNFGIMYGISAFGLSQSLGIDREEAAAYIERYFQRMPRVKAFIESTIETARRQGYVSTLFGRRRPIPELTSGSFQERSLGERLAVNSVIQGTAADIIKVAMIRCHDRLRNGYPAAKLVLQVHDELVFEAPEHLVDEVNVAMVGEMVGAFPMDPPLRVDVGVGPDWLSAK
ncbi:MAG TPA: DNA polymerase I [Thermoleophilia bacterium]|nr:DNA polymerase I [Thermoleophilia bacterium]